MRKFFRVFLFTLATASFAISCKKKEGENPRWDTEILTPIIKTNLSFQDLWTDSLVKANSDNSLSLVYRQQLYSSGLDSLVKLGIKPFSRRKSLESLVLQSDTISYTLTLGELARRMIASGESMGAQILSLQGKPMILPTISGLSAGPLTIDLSDILKKAKIQSGELQIVIDNGLPINLRDISIEARNYTQGDLILQKQISSINRKTVSDTVKEDLAGKIIEGKMSITMPQLTVGAGVINQVDTNDALVAYVIIKNIKVEEATAVFPSQNVIDNEDNSALQDMRDVKLTKAIVKSGKLKLSAKTTAQDTIYYTFSVPGASRDGKPFILSDKIAPVIGGVTSKELEYDISGYTLDLTGKNKDTINAIYNHIVASIRNTGKEFTFSLADYVDVNITFEDLEPSYVEGYLGKDTIEIAPGEVAFDFMNKLKADQLSFKDIKLSLDVENSIGAGGFVDIDYLKAINNSETKTALHPAIGNIPRATSLNESAFATIPLSSDNPPLVDLLNIRPGKIGYAGKVYLNKDASDNDLTQFVSDKSKVTTWLNLELPLNLITKNLILSRDVELPKTTIKSPISTGVLNILAWNQYPLDATVTVRFYDSNGNKIDELTGDNVIAAGQIDQASGRVTKPKYSKISYSLDITRLNRMLEANKATFEVNFNSQPSNENVKIYSDYTLELRLSGDFNYTVNFK